MYRAKNRKFQIFFSAALLSFGGASAGDMGTVRVHIMDNAGRESGADDVPGSKLKGYLDQQMSQGMRVMGGTINLQAQTAQAPQEPVAQAPQVMPQQFQLNAQSSEEDILQAIEAGLNGDSIDALCNNLKNISPEKHAMLESVMWNPAQTPAQERISYIMTNHPNGMKMMACIGNQMKKSWW